MQKRIVISVSCLVGSLAMPALANSDLWLFSLSYDQDMPSIAAARQLTDTPDYTNQPHFDPARQQLLYTQSFAAGTTTQTDAMAYDLVQGYHTHLTFTPESEYSPTPLPKAPGFSAIQVDKQNKQWLMQFGLDERPDKFSPVEPVGYHVWVDKDQALAFVLGEPHTLQMLTPDSARKLDEAIGPSLWPIPGTSLFSYTKNPAPDSQPWALMSYDPANDQSSVLATLPDNANYMAWTPGGKALTVVDSQIMAWDFREPVTAAGERPSATAEPQWQVWLDISEQCPAGASRLHMNPAGNYLAVVCNRPD